MSYFFILLWIYLQYCKIATTICSQCCHTLLRLLNNTAMERDRDVKMQIFIIKLTLVSTTKPLLCIISRHFPHNARDLQNTDKDKRISPLLNFILIIPSSSKMLLWEVFYMRSHVSAELRWPQNRIARKNAKNVLYFVVFI